MTQVDAMPGPETTPPAITLHGDQDQAWSRFTLSEFTAARANGQLSTEPSAESRVDESQDALYVELDTDHDLHWDLVRARTDAGHTYQLDTTSALELEQVPADARSSVRDLTSFHASPYAERTQGHEASETPSASSDAAPDRSGGGRRSSRGRR